MYVDLELHAFLKPPLSPLQSMRGRMNGLRVSADFNFYSANSESDPVPQWQCGNFFSKTASTPGHFVYDKRCGRLGKRGM